MRIRLVNEVIRWIGVVLMNWVMVGTVQGQSIDFSTIKDSNSFNSASEEVWQVKYEDTELFGRQCDELIEIARDIDFKSGEGVALYYKGVYYYLKDELEPARIQLEQSNSIWKLINSKKGLSKNYNLLGLLADTEGDYPQALEYYMLSLTLKEELNDRLGMANTLNNIGSIYNYEEKFDKAIQYFQRSMSIYTDLSDSAGIANSLNNLGLVYHKKEDKERALDFYLKSLAIEEKLANNPMNLALSYNNIGSLYNGLNEYDLAIYYYNKGFEIYKAEGSLRGKALITNNLAESYRKLKAYDKAEEHALQGLKWARAAEAKDDVRQSFECLMLIEKGRGNYKDALDYQEAFFKIRDSLFNVEKTKEIAIIEAQYSLKQQEQAQAALEQELRKKQTQRYKLMASGLLGSSMLILYFLALFQLLHKGLYRWRNALLIVGLFFSFYGLMEFFYPLVEEFSGAQSPGLIVLFGMFGIVLVMVHVKLQHLDKKKNA